MTAEPRIRIETVTRAPRVRANALALLLLAACATLGACARSGPDGAGAKKESTTALGLRVKFELLQKLGTDGVHVDVEAEGTRVVLAGEVKKRATAELAEEVARQVEGVASVENRIRVAGGDGGSQVDRALAEAENELADAALETSVHLALIDRLGSDGFRIGTDAASGVVTLEFPKSIEPDRRRDAIATARKVDGVKKVVSLDKE